MDGHTGLGLALLAASLVLLVVVAAAEAGVVTMSRARIRLMAGRGVPRAEFLHHQLQERSTLLGSLALARNLAVVSSSALGLFLLARETGSTWQAVLIAGAGTLGVLALLEALLRFLVSQSPERWGLRLAPLIEALRLVFGLPAAGLALPARALMRLPFLKGSRATKQEEEVAGEDELLRLMEMGEANGGIEAEERAMIRGIINLVETTTHEIMVPRIDVVAVDTEAELDEVMRLIVERGFSRIPLYEGTIDNVVGVLYVKDLVRYLAADNRPANLKEIARPAYFVPESKKVDELLAEMRQNKVHMAIVVDEYGGTAGIVTIEDLLEEIVGEIEDEYDRSEVTIERVSENEAVLDARVSIDDLNEIFGVTIEGEDFDTVGGFVYRLLGKMPAVGDEVSANGLHLRVLSVLGRRLKKIRVTRQPETAAQAAPDGQTPS